MCITDATKRPQAGIAVGAVPAEAPPSNRYKIERHGNVMFKVSCPAPTLEHNTQPGHFPLFESRRLPQKGSIINNINNELIPLMTPIHQSDSPRHAEKVSIINSGLTPDAIAASRERGEFTRTRGAPSTTKTPSSPSVSDIDKHSVPHNMEMGDMRRRNTAETAAML